MDDSENSNRKDFGWYLRILGAPLSFSSEMTSLAATTNKETRKYVGTRGILS